MPKPTEADLTLKDTPALSILTARSQSFPGIEAGSLAVAQDLLRVAKRVLGTFGGEFAGHGLSPGRYSVLMTLYERDEALAPSQIAERIGVARATITGLVAGLVGEGLVTVEGAEGGDRRRKTVRLSDHGRRVLERLLPDIFSRMNALVAPLSAGERAQLQDLLGRVEAQLPEFQSDEIP